MFENLGSLLQVQTDKITCVSRELKSAWTFAQPDQSLPYALWVVKDLKDSKDSDQTGLMEWMEVQLWPTSPVVLH